MRSLLLSFLLCILMNNIFAQNLVPQKNENSWDFLDLQSNSVIKTNYELIQFAFNGYFIFKKNGLYGVYQEATKSELISPEYFSIKVFDNSNFLVANNEYLGIINKKNEIIIPFKYTDLAIYKNNSQYIIAKEQNLYGVINYENKTIVPFKFSTPPLHLSSIDRLLDSTYLIVSILKDNKNYYGLVNANFKTLIPYNFKTIAPKYKSIECYDFNNIKYLYTIDGQFICKDFETYVSTFQNRYVIVELNNSKYKIHWIQTGKDIIVDEYSGLIANKYIRCKINSEECFVDSNATIVSLKGENIYYNQNGEYFYIKKEGKNNEMLYGLLDANFKEILPIKYHKLLNSTKDYCVAGSIIKDSLGKKRELFGIIKLSNAETIIPYIYEDIILFSTGYSAMKKDGFYKIYNPQFKPISDSLYTNVYYRNPSYDLKMKINQKFILVEKYENNYSNNNNYYSKIRGYIDYTGKVVIPIEFEKIDMITDVYGKPVGKGYINANNKKLKKSIIYDLDGNIIVPFKYSRFGCYKNGFIEAVEYEMFDDEMRGVVGLIDTLGNQILPPKFDNIVDIKSSRIIAERNGKYGLYDMNNNEIISKKYDNIKFLDDSLVIVSYIRKFGVFDIKGNQLTEIKYTEIKKSKQPNTIEAYIDKKLFYISIKKN